MNRYIFTVTAGRSGQATLAHLLQGCVSNQCTVFEGPQINYIFSKKHNLPDQHKGILADIERHFRRRYVETHELLGRGKILSAYESGNIEYIKKISRKRINSIDLMLKKNRKGIYIDVSKHFAKGLHLGFQQLLPKISLIHLIRDPILNMRSFLNREKNFYLDNGHPCSERNMLKLDIEWMKKSDLYLWAWFEMALRYENMKELGCIDRYTEIQTNKLDDSTYIANCLDNLGLSHSAKEEDSMILNTNESSGYKKTNVSKCDVESFERFIENIPFDFVKKIPYLHSYDPYLVHQVS